MRMHSAAFTFPFSSPMNFTGAVSHSNCTSSSTAFTRSSQRPGISTSLRQYTQYTLASGFSRRAVLTQSIDAKGRRSPVPIEGSNFIIDCDTAVLAIGYSLETDIPETTPNLKTTKWGSVIVESEETGLTSREDLYAAGDNVRGADLVVTAVATAGKAAASMHLKLMATREKKAAYMQSSAGVQTYQAPMSE